MADRPILFSAPMIRALLEGRKTQTRRVIKSARVFATPERPAFTLVGDDLARAMQNADRFRQIDGDGWFWEADAFEWQHPHTRTGWMAHIGYAPGDRLWVREAWHAARSHNRTPPRDIPHDASIEHAATARGYAEIGLKGKLRPGIHMPRWASRLTLIVESVKVERLNEISEEDARAEGVEPLHHGFYPYGISTFMTVMKGDREVPAQCCRNAKDSFHLLWNSINGAGSWDANPWIVAVTFRVIRANIDSEEARNG